MRFLESVQRSKLQTVHKATLPNMLGVLTCKELQNKRLSGEAWSGCICLGVNGCITQSSSVNYHLSHVTLADKHANNLQIRRGFTTTSRKLCDLLPDVVVSTLIALKTSEHNKGRHDCAGSIEPLLLAGSCNTEICCNLTHPSSKLPS